MGSSRDNAGVHTTLSVVQVKLTEQLEGSGNVKTNVKNPFPYARCKF